MLIEELKVQKDLNFAKKELHTEISYIQNHQITNLAVAIEKLAKLYILEKGKEVLSLINADDYEKGITREEREIEVESINKEIEKLKSEQPKYTGMEFNGEDYLIMWKVIAPRFCEPVDCNGKFLNVKEDLDKRLLKIYNKLELGDIPKIRLDYPIKIENKEYSVPPGYYSPLRGNKDKK